MTVPARKPRSTKPKREYKDELMAWMKSEPQSLGLKWTVMTEHRFHPVRRWRFDYVWLNTDGEHTKIAVEFDGIFGGRSHTSVPGVMRDQQKINEAQLLGWQVFRANARSIADGTFYALMTNVLIERARIGE